MKRSDSKEHNVSKIINNHAQRIGIQGKINMLELMAYKSIIY
jgi:hypothetical protein